MIFNEKVTGVFGFAGTVPIGKASRGSWRWHVEIFHKAPDLRAFSWRESRLLLAVHGADRVEMVYQMQVIWPAGIQPPHEAYLPPRQAREKTILDHLPKPGSAPANIFFQPVSPWHQTWVAAFPSNKKIE